MNQKLSTRPATRQLGLWLLTAVLFAASPLTAYAQGTYSPNFTCNPRETRADFDGDCKTDISTFNRSTGLWASLDSSSGNANYVFFYFGQSGDIAAPGDYNGDGKTDRAVFRPGSPAVWYIETDITSSWFDSVAFGQSGDIPVARDYDGDNIADVAVFRPGDGFWYIRKSSSNPTWSSNIWISVQFGQTGDRVVPGDYDGDGKTDIAVFRPGATHGTWWVLRSSNGSHYAIQWGLNSDWPVQADYDGDGKIDMVIFRPGTGQWWVLKSSDSSHYAVTWGVSGDRPVPGDYDGDGRADIAFQRPGDGTWHILKSTGGSLSPFYFIYPDFPVPGAYLTPLY